MRAQAGILTIGNELLKGTVLNTNAHFLARELSMIGFDVTAQSSCPDELKSISEQFEQLSSLDLLIVSGGLGPTPDDVTRQAVAEYFAKPLVISKRQLSFIQTAYSRRGKKMPAMVRQEAMFPKGSVPLFNHYGIALGFYLMAGKQMVVVLPGVPGEMERMFQNLVQPVLLRNFSRRIAKKFSLIVKLIGISEPETMKRLGKDFFDDPFDFGIYPDTAEVVLRLYADSRSVIQKLRKKISARLKKFICTFDETPFKEVVGKLLISKRKTLSVAESCTGGLLASEITKIPGASRYFKGGVIAYDNKVKSGFLEIPAGLIMDKGAVSREVAAAMAQGIMKKTNTDFGIAITGIAGPEGGSKSKPIGLVYIAMASPNKTTVHEEFFHGDRTQIQNKAAKKAMNYLWQMIR